MFPIKRTIFLCTVTLVKNMVHLIGNIYTYGEFFKEFFDVPILLRIFLQNFVSILLMTYLCQEVIDVFFEEFSDVFFLHNVLTSFLRHSFDKFLDP